MRTHSDIIKAAGEEAIVSVTNAPVHTVRSWAQRDSIPARQWAALVIAGFCTADELMVAAAVKRGQAKAA